MSVSDLARRFCPRYFFDSRETHFPVDFNAYVYAYPDTDTGPLIRDVVHVYERHLIDGTTWIYYMCFYTYDNGACCCHIDAHELDFEYVIVEVKYDRIVRVCFCPHGTAENFWLSERDTAALARDHTSGRVDESGVEVDADAIEDHIHVYVSKWKHAHYPISGLVWRYFGMANDTCDVRTRIDLRPVPLDDTSIDSVLFASQKKKLTYDYNAIHTVPIEDVRTRMLWKLPTF